MSFAQASAVQPTGTEGAYAGEIKPGWDIVGNANGGYLMAMAARAASMNAGGRLPATVTAHFMAPGKPGPATIDVRPHKTGRRFSTLDALLSDADRPLLALIGSFSERNVAPHPVTRIETAPPEMPPPDDCIPIEPTETFPPPFMGRVELRLHPEDASFTSGVPRFRGWFRLRNEEPIDTFGLLVAVDAFPPTVFAAQMPIAWTPTLELTAHVRGVPEKGWLRCMFTTRFISGGSLEDDGEVWDASGRLVAQSRQLALLPAAGS